MSHRLAGPIAVLMPDTRGLTSVEYAVVLGILAPVLGLSFSGLAAKLQSLMSALPI